MGTYKLDLLTNQAHSITATYGTVTAIDGPLPLILGPGPGHSAPKFTVEVKAAPLVEFEMPSSRYTTDGTPFDLGSGFTFTTAPDVGAPFPLLPPGWSATSQANPWSDTGYVVTNIGGDPSVKLTILLSTDGTTSAVMHETFTTPQPVRKTADALHFTALTSDVDSTQVSIGFYGTYLPLNNWYADLYNDGDVDELAYPEVLWVTPTPEATGVPLDIYLELGFSQPMDPDSVLDSTLRITDVDGKDSAGDAGYSFDIQIREAATASAPLGPLSLLWNTDRTILQLTSDYSLKPENKYRLQMVVNKARAADVGGVDGLPLILGQLGTQAIDLRDGFTFTTGAAGTSSDQYPTVESVTLGRSPSDAFQRQVVVGTMPTSVPLNPKLVMNFSHSMHEGSVLASTLRITDITGGDDVADDRHSADYSFDIQIGAAKEAGLVALDWTNADKTVSLTLSGHTLVGGNKYRLQMVDNNARAADVGGADGLPLILAGDDGGTPDDSSDDRIDLRSGFVFRANHVPTIEPLQDSGGGPITEVAGMPQVERDEDENPGYETVKMSIEDLDPSTDWGQVDEDGSGSFTVDGKLTFKAVSSNDTLLPNTSSNIDIDDSTNGWRSVNLIPASNQHGETILTFTISDGVDWTQKQLRLIVNAVNDEPSWSVIGDVEVPEDAAAAGTGYTVVETADGSKVTHSG